MSEISCAVYVGTRPVARHRRGAGRHRAAPRPLSSYRSALALAGSWVTFMTVMTLSLTVLL
ncbi:MULTISPECIES: hypothetical protein [Nocardia]|uniref:hypothetical protein n=1 Tax=Nocardia TaxID=1817 RepID=UPI002457DC54|nr:MULTISPECIES: hypothetical protein [Nocardia]